MPHRYFTTEISDGTATLRGADAHHLARVMRARLGDTVILCDGNAVEYTATITGFGDECVEFRVEPGYPSAAEPSVEVTLLAGYPKQDKLEQIIKHGVELGAAHIVPFFSRYCVAAPKKEEQKNERYNRIAAEAAKQCGRGVLPDVALPLANFGAVCRTFAQYDLVLFCYECGGAPLRDLLAAAKPADGEKLKIAIVTGAEGGFAAEEAEMAAKAGAKHLTLAYPLVGPNIKRFAALQAAFPEVEFFAIGDDTEQIRKLGQTCKANVLMDVDMGQHRTGVPLDKVEAMYREWNTLPGIVMRGMHCYDGHRHESSVQEREVATAPVDKQIEEIKARLKADGICCEILIMGGTPSFPVHAEMTGEFLSPGTCVIQDAGYRNAYPDLKFTPAAALLTRVVSRPSRDTFTLDLGCKAVATDPQPERAEIVGMEYARTVIQNEEHWVVRVPEEHIADIPPIGTELFAIPTHVCPTSALYPAVPVVENGKVTGWWKVAARDRRLTL